MSSARFSPRLLGPTIIVAAVVCGPGSILTSSKVGAQFGYDALWVLLFAAVLMVGMVTLATRIGVACEHSPCEELARRLGRPFAAAVGIVIFIVITCFQSSNNIAFLAGLEPLLSPELDATGAASSPTFGKGTTIATLTLVNIILIVAIYAARTLYGKVELLMKMLVFVMIGAFVINFLKAGPSLSAALSGLVPRIPPGADGFFAKRVDGKVVDSLWSVQALMATTFSVAGAFYQAYLVREKGWTLNDTRKGMIDSIVGVGVLCGITSMIMMTSAATFFGKVDVGSLKSVGDVARQLEPFFGAWARVVFSIGIFAGALSSFLVNAMIGGSVLSDGLGLGSGMDQRWPRHLTTLSLLTGLGVALFSVSTGTSHLNLIIFAQALTVLGIPALALALLYLGTRPRMNERGRVRPWVLVLGGIGFLLSCLLAARTAWNLYLKSL
jgi:manganese transport protein